MVVRRGRPTEAQPARRNYRRTQLAAAGVGALCLATWLAGTGASASTAVSAGQGSASAFTDRLDPRAGSLSIGVTFGEALAGHQNSEAKAQSQSMDLGVIGTSLTSYDCGQSPSFQPSQLPQPLIVESGDPNASSGVSQSEEGGVFTKFAQADTTPYSKAVTKSAPVSLAGIVEIGGGTATSYSGLVNGQRVAGATVDLSGITLPGGTSLSGLHWEATYPSTSGAAPSGSFSIGHAVIAGVAAPTNNPTQTLAALNAVLNQIGLQFTPPTVRLVQGTMYVDPLQLSVVPNATRDHVLGTILGGIQPITQQTFENLLKVVCKADSAITVAQIAIGAISGAGSMNIELGGVNASSGTIAANQFVFGTPQFTGGLNASNATATNGASLTSGSSTATGSLGTGTATATPSLGTGAGAVPSSGAAPASAGGSGSPDVSRGVPIKALGGKGAGALAGVALSGLAALGVVAEGDRRLMRRAQRTVSFEE